MKLGIQLLILALVNIGMAIFSIKTGGLSKKEAINISIVSFALATVLLKLIGVLG